MANVQVADPPFQPFNFGAASVNILAPMETMSSTGRRIVLGTDIGHGIVYIYVRRSTTKRLLEI